MEAKPTRPPLRYHGGKWRLAPWIISHFPEHRIYTEAFGGGASVLLRKARSYSEVYNDLDGEVVNFFRVLQDRNRAAELIYRLRHTPFARNEFELAYKQVDDEIEKARRMAIRSLMGFGTAGFNRNHKTGFRANTTRSGTVPAHDWTSYPDILPGIIERLQGVVIEYRDAVTVIQSHDSEGTLHYIDPPYVHETRAFHKAVRVGYDKVYAHEMTNEDHRQLSEVLHSLKGMVILSGYACDLYDKELYPDWMRVTCDTIASSNNASVPRTEVLWLNPAAAQRQSQLHLFDGKAA